MKAELFWDIVLVLILLLTVSIGLWVYLGAIGSYIFAGIIVVMVAFIWIGVTHGWHYV